MAGVEVPAMGAWKIGHLRPIFSSNDVPAILLI
jgi:hypothetical protein